MAGVQVQTRAATEALDWNTGRRQATCLYGEITVLATIQGMYYCGAQFNQGYTGIQHLGHNLHTALFSLWDTSPKLRAKITESDPKSRPGSFSGEGTGAHVNLDGSWTAGKIYKFFLQKQPGRQPNTTDTSFYVIDVSGGEWRHVATINTPNGPKHVGEAFGGVSSWIENIGGGANFATPKIVLYDLWLGTNIHEMKRLTRSGGESGSGRWGQLHGQYFLAEGSRANLDAAFARLKRAYGKPVFGMDGKELSPLPDKPLPNPLPNTALEPTPTAP
jgi:hypothetical protein